MQIEIRVLGACQRPLVLATPPVFAQHPQLHRVFDAHAVVDALEVEVIPSGDQLGVAGRCIWPVVDGSDLAGVLSRIVTPRSDDQPVLIAEFFRPVTGDSREVIDGSYQAVPPARDLVDRRLHLRVNIAEMLDFHVLDAVIVLQLVVQLRKDLARNIAKRQPPDVLAALDLVPAFRRFTWCRRAIGEFGPAAHIGSHHVRPLKPTASFEDTEVEVQGVLHDAARKGRCQARGL